VPARLLTAFVSWGEECWDSHTRTYGQFCTAPWRAGSLGLLCLCMDAWKGQACACWFMLRTPNPAHPLNHGGSVALPQQN
jgi:hypothetical protein